MAKPVVFILMLACFATARTVGENASRTRFLLLDNRIVAHAEEAVLTVGTVKKHAADPCSEKVLAYDYGCVYACACSVFLNNEIRLYYGASDYQHFGWRNGSLCVAVLRPDGFAGYEQKSKEKAALVTTTAIPYGGQKVRVTADVNRGGSVRVSVVDDKGQNVATAGAVSETVTDVPLKWDRKMSAATIRLKFEIVNAKLYSFSLAE